MARVNPLPEGYHSVTPFLTVAGAAQAIDFYKRAFGAVEKFRLPGPGGKVLHAELGVGDSTIMLTDAINDPPSVMFWGDRYGSLRDPFGNTWAIASHVRTCHPGRCRSVRRRRWPR